MLVVPGYSNYHVDKHNQPVFPEDVEVQSLVVSRYMQELLERGIVESVRHDPKLFRLKEQMMWERFEHQWTSVSPRGRELMFAITASLRPERVLCAGVFWGSTLYNCVAAGVGDTKTYQLKEGIGIEIDETFAGMARRNMAAIDPEGVVRVVCADAFTFCRSMPSFNYDLVYIDLGGHAIEGEGYRQRKASMYLRFLETFVDDLKPGAVLVAHNAIDHAELMRDYFSFVRTSSRIRQSVTVAIDSQGFEISVVAP